jgi:hypothetical protein
MSIDHPELLRAQSILARIYETLGQFDYAEVLLLNVVEAKQKKFGLAHPETILSNVQLSLLFNQNNHLVLHARQATVHVNPRRFAHPRLTHP